MYVCLYVCILCIYACLYVYIYVCIYVCMYVNTGKIIVFGAISGQDIHFQRSSVQSERGASKYLVGRASGVDRSWSVPHAAADQVEESKNTCATTKNSYIPCSKLLHYVRVHLLVRSS